MWVRVAFTAWARSSRESTRVPSRSKMRRSMPPPRRRALPFAGADGARDGLAAGVAVADAVLLHLALQRIAVDAQLFAGGALIAAALLQRVANHALLQNLDRFRQENVRFEQMLDQPVKSFFHSVSFPRRAACEC